MFPDTLPLGPVHTDRECHVTSGIAYHQTLDLGLESIPARLYLVTFHLL